MARPRNLTPTYKLHKPTGSARCWLNGQWITLGKYGSPESRQAHARICAELAVAPDPVTIASAANPSTDPTVDQVLVAYLKYAEKHYRGPNGKPTSQLAEYRQTIRAIREVYGLEPCSKFGPLALKTVRQRMVDAGLSRAEVNRRVMLARRMFKWAAGEELIPFGVYQRLTTVSGLQRGRTDAPETEPIQPVDLNHVRRVSPYLNSQVRGVIEFMMLTGARPGEACRLRRCDLDTSGDVWIYRPHHHKNTHRGKSRAAAVGPRAQELLRLYPTDAPTDYVFDPRKAVEEMYAQRTAARKTPRYASHMRRNAAKRTKNPKRPAGERYTTEALDRAVARAIDRLNWTLIEAGVDVELHVPKWTANQIRHTYGTAVRRIFGLEGAQSVLGHERANTTEIYAEKNLALAVKVASVMG